MSASALDLGPLCSFVFIFSFSLHSVLAFSLSCFFFLLVITVSVPQYGLYLRLDVERGREKIRAGNRPFITPFFFSRRPPITTALQNDE
ncbi:hypothetical protein ACN38_g5172 [Penicillium nordicum]|uniref:Uncharacterized protein n=1 Tax=Penicillium nordicum TaxID=229535 RepID=A0A0M8P982_9EURO|nr:hypothetical protein ACN38_g5172 [Penicillium nordicum]